MTKRPSNYEEHLRGLAEQAAGQLAGTCKAIYDLGPEFEDAANEQAFCNRLDELVFECQCCNWWFEQSEMAVRKDEQWICTECTEESELA